MTKSKKLTSLALFVGLIVGANSAVYAAEQTNQPPQPHHVKPGSMGHKTPFAGLDLSKEQQDKINKILTDSRDDNKEAFEHMQDVQKKLHDLAWSDDYSDDKAKSIIDDQKDKAADWAVDRAKTDHEIYQVLTPEQRQKFKSMQDRIKNGPERGMEEKRDSMPPSPRAGEPTPPPAPDPQPDHE